MAINCDEQPTCGVYINVAVGKLWTKILCLRIKEVIISLSSSATPIEIQSATNLQKNMALKPLVSDTMSLSKVHQPEAIIEQEKLEDMKVGSLNNNGTKKHMNAGRRRKRMGPGIAQTLLIAGILSTCASSVSGSLGPDICEALVTFPKSIFVIRNVTTMESYVPQPTVICPEVEPIGHGYNVCFLNETCVKISGLIEDGTCPDFNVEYGERRPVTKRIELQRKVSTSKKSTIGKLKLQKQPVPDYISAIIFVVIFLVVVIFACRENIFHSCSTWEK
ncbi:uncharacterized protein O3C94_013241 isoform 1-T2 [Discoglossus pictus]